MFRKKGKKKEKQKKGNSMGLSFNNDPPLDDQIEDDEINNIGLDLDFAKNRSRSNNLFGVKSNGIDADFNFSEAHITFGDHRPSYELNIEEMKQENQQRIIDEYPSLKEEILELEEGMMLQEQARTSTHTLDPSPNFRVDSSPSYLSKRPLIYATIDNNRVRTQTGLNDSTQESKIDSLTIEMMETKLRLQRPKRRILHDASEILTTNASDASIAMDIEEHQDSYLDEFEDVDMNNESFLEIEEKMIKSALGHNLRIEFKEDREKIRAQKKLQSIYRRVEEANLACIITEMKAGLSHAQEAEENLVLQQTSLEGQIRFNNQIINNEEEEQKLKDDLHEVDEILSKFVEISDICIVKNPMLERAEIALVNQIQFYKESVYRFMEKGGDTSLDFFEVFVSKDIKNIFAAIDNNQKLLSHRKALDTEKEGILGGVIQIMGDVSDEFLEFETRFNESFFIYQYLKENERSKEMIQSLCSFFILIANFEGHRYNPIHHKEEDAVFINRFSDLEIYQDIEAKMYGSEHQEAHLLQQIKESILEEVVIKRIGSILFNEVNWVCQTDCKIMASEVKLIVEEYYGNSNIKNEAKLVHIHSLVEQAIKGIVGIAKALQRSYGFIDNVFYQSCLISLLHNLHRFEFLIPKRKSTELVILIIFESFLEKITKPIEYCPYHKFILNELLAVAKSFKCFEDFMKEKLNERMLLLLGPAKSLKELILENLR